MAKSTIPQKTIVAEKRFFQGTDEGSFINTAFTLSWASLALASIVLAGISFLTTDFSQRQFFADAQFVDPQTTAAITPNNRGITVAKRQAQPEEDLNQKQKIDDITQIVNRLRSEQATINFRLQEIENLLNRTVERTTSLEEELKKSLALAKNTKLSAIVKSPSTPPNLDPEDQGNFLPDHQKSLEPRTVKIERVTNGDINSVINREAKGQKGEEEATSSFAKTSSAKKEEKLLDTTIVGSINRAQESQFAIDLGVSSTQERAADLWNSLAAAHANILAELAPQYLPTGSDEGQTRLVAGPYHDANDAIKACVSLRINKAYCKTTLYPKGR